MGLAEILKIDLYSYKPSLTFAGKAQFRIQNRIWNRGYLHHNFILLVSDWSFQRRNFPEKESQPNYNRGKLLN
jgi:hypothetical protein